MTDFSNFYPYQIIRAVPDGLGMKFLCPEHQLVIREPDAKNLWKILEFCDGNRDSQAIANKTDLKLSVVEGYLSSLANYGLVRDSRELFWEFHKVSCYPADFNQNLKLAEVERLRESKRAPVQTGKPLNYRPDELSGLSKIISSRRSVRAFTGAPLSLDLVGNICRTGYHIPAHASPSGGSLYPLKIFVLVEVPQTGLDIGYYEYDAETDVLVSYFDEPDLEQLKYCFNSATMPFNSSVQLIIAGDLSRQPQKYANRGYRLTLLEAGHVAENMLLYCTEQGIGACELGGLLDLPLKKELKLAPEIWPILGIAVGHEDKSVGRISDTDKLAYAEEKFVGNGKLISTYSVSHPTHEEAFFGVTATSKDGHTSSSTSTSYCDAVFKSAVEGYERYWSRRPKVDICTSANQLALPYLSPKEIAPLTPMQLHQCGLTPFHEDLPIDWTLGHTYDGQDIAIPVDLVFYGNYPSRNRVSWSNSSGIAAHTDLMLAKQLALAELIERDAIMRHWFLHIPGESIDAQSIDVHVHNRQLLLESRGRNLKLLYLPSYYGDVFLAVITGTTYPYFVCGAAATFTGDYEQAEIKAVREAEYRLYCEVRNVSHHQLKPTSVKTPLDHGRLYAESKYASKLRWLTATSQYEHIAQRRQHNLSDLEKELQVVWCELPGDNPDFHIVKAISPKLVPISFGYWNTYDTHPALPYRSSQELPHFFA